MSQAVDIGALASFPEGKPTALELDGRAVVICHTGGAVHVLDGTCPHRGGPLAEGFIADGCLVCPWHGWAFNLKSGMYASGVGVRTYPAAAVGDRVVVTR